MKAKVRLENFSLVITYSLVDIYLLFMFGLKEILHELNYVTTMDWMKICWTGRTFKNFSSIFSSILINKSSTDRVVWVFKLTSIRLIYCSCIDIYLFLSISVLEVHWKSKSTFDFQQLWWYNLNNEIELFSRIPFPSFLNLKYFLQTRIARIFIFLWEISVIGIPLYWNFVDII